MRSRLDNLEGVRINVQAQKDGPGGGLPIHIEIYNDDLEKGAKATQIMREIMVEMGGFVDTVDSRPMPGIEWTLDFDRNEASRHGVSIDALGNMVKLLTAGVSISDYRPDDTDEELDIKLRFPSDQRNLDRLEELRVPTASGEYVPLSVFAKLIPKQKGGDIQRKNGQRFYYIDSNVETGILPDKQIEKLEKNIFQ